MNITTITGNVTKDAEIRYTKSGKAIAGFTIANNVGWGDNKKTNFFRCTIWGERGEKIADYIRKGSRLTVSGEVSLNEYESNGEKRASLELNVREVELPPRSESGAPAQDQHQQDKQNGYQSADDYSDDIPF